MLTEGDEDIDSIINDKYQTLSILGFDEKEIIDFLVRKRARGIDRVVPVGKTLEFDLIWDGYDLILTMSRVIT